jgi:DNA-binding CsgD family transcriptional regulator
MKLTTQQRFWQKVDKSAGCGPWGNCWIWIGAVNDSGYGKLAANGSQAYRAHRYSYELVNGPLAKGVCVLHKCDVRRCVRPDHLFEGTRADNNRDTSSKGRIRGGQGKGSAHPKAVLDEEIVARIWSLRHFGLSPGKIARMLGLNRSTVKNVIYGDYWSHIYTKAA